MEKKTEIENNSIDVNKFFINCSNVSSDFFINLFKNDIKNIIINKEKDDPIFICVNIIFNKNTANYFNIVHGGSIALLFENIVHMLLFHLTNNIYNTKDISNLINFIKYRIYISNKNRKN